MAKQDRGIRTRRVILEAAAEVFEERGYDAAKITDILTRAGVTKGALYFHFDSKKALALAVLDAQVAQAPRQLPQASKLQEFVDLGMVFAHRLSYDPLVRGSVRLTLDDMGVQLDRSGPYVAWAEIHTRTLQEARDRGELLAHVDPVESAILLVGAYAGVNMMARTTNKRHELDQRASTLYRHLMPSIAVPAVLATLDMAPGRGARALAEAEGTAAVRDEVVAPVDG
ncbi:ScbR family autoregulator-binding transcription factor [Streptomyces apocyni]|uniref:ScbR family autoregulator-binding transcription factor n=1 Tax=Streptomyces apocyni TaxID=2654677 RepID=UPI0012EA260E|nr:ScbR family autoregulator-binding transcription factor [Streptomyces apocyni]